jgi:hypothetical protein
MDTDLSKHVVVTNARSHISGHVVIHKVSSKGHLHIDIFIS